jgi:membrane protease YdiL (CAAX protease family)
MLTVPIEEWLFRGVILRQLLRFGAPLAVLVSAVVSAAAHGSLFRSVPLLAVGVIVGVIYVRTVSLWPCIVAHLTYNATLVTIALLIPR